MVVESFERLSHCNFFSHHPQNRKRDILRKIHPPLFAAAELAKHITCQTEKEIARFPSLEDVTPVADLSNLDSPTKKRLSIPCLLCIVFVFFFDCHWLMNCAPLVVV